MSIAAVRNIPEAEGLGAQPASVSASLAARKSGLSIPRDETDTVPANENFDNGSFGAEPILARSANGQAPDRSRQTSIDASEIDRVLLEGADCDLDPLLGKLAAAARSATTVIAPSPALSEVTRPIGAPGLAPEAVEEDDSVLRELDKLIARLDAEAAQARAAKLPQPLPATRTAR